MDLLDCRLEAPERRPAAEVSTEWMVVSSADITISKTIWLIFGNETIEGWKGFQSKCRGSADAA